MHNTISECDNGIWGGYSYNTTIAENTLDHNHVGIAIEHGQNDTLYANYFSENKTAVKLWARAEQPKDWGYAQKRETRSKNYSIINNKFISDEVALDISLTTGVRLIENSFKNIKTRYKVNNNVAELDSTYEFYSPANHFNLPSRYAYSKKIVYPEGRKEIRITQWGPYDFRYPILWLTKIDSSGKMYFDILGPKGTWKINTFKGVKNISLLSGTFPSSITAEKITDDVLLEATYTGESFTTQFGSTNPKGKAFNFLYRDFDPKITWDVKWYSWDLSHDPNKNYSSFTKLFNGTAIKQEITKKLDYTWWGELGKNLPADSFATVAIGMIQVPKGIYDMGVTADDLIKVFIDGKLVIDFWDATKYVNDEDAHHSVNWQSDGKKHNIRVEHVENAGYATLIFSLKPV